MEDEAKVERTRDKWFRYVTDSVSYLTRHPLTITAAITAAIAIAISIAMGFSVTVHDWESPFWQSFPVSLWVIVQTVSMFAVWWWSRRYEPEVRTSELDRVILATRTCLREISRVDLREELPFELPDAGNRTALRILAGVTVTLATLAREPMKVHWRERPFPAKCRREDLIAAIIYSGGVSRRSAERLLEALSGAIRRRIAVASKGEITAIELFPLGLYENITEDDATFSPQPILLERGYPGLPGVLASYEATRRAE